MATLWSAGNARRSMVTERTHNPSPAAHSMLGARRVKQAERALKRGGRKRAYKGNPLPALAALLSKAQIIGKIGGVVKGLLGHGPDPAKQAIRLQRIHDFAVAALTDDAAGQKAYADLQAIANREENHGVAINDVTVNAAASLVQEVRNAILTGAGTIQGGAPTIVARPPAPTVSLGSLLGTPTPAATYAPVAVPIVRELVRAAKPRRRARYPAYRDRYGRSHYSNKPPGSEFRLPAGAEPLVEAGVAAPYNFFRSAVGAGGLGTTAAQLGVAAAAGAGAYLVTQKLLQYLGGRAQSAEEAGVNAARAHREALLAYPAQKAEINAAYFAKLAELGYDPHTFTRTRSGFDQFLETYNPLGG